MNAAIKFVNTFRAEYGGTELFNPVKEAFNRRLGDLELEIGALLALDGAGLHLFDESRTVVRVDDGLADSEAHVNVTPFAP